MIELKDVHELTVDDLETLPDGHRYELHEGNLVIMSPATLWRSDIEHRLTAWLRSQGRLAYPEIGIRFGKQHGRTADIAIFVDRPNSRQAWFEPHEISVVIEIVSPSSMDDDRFMKPHLYAQGGVAEYWRVEREKDGDEAIIFQHKLAHTKDGTAAYVETGVTTLSVLEQAAS